MSYLVHSFAAVTCIIFSAIAVVALGLCVKIAQKLLLENGYERLHME
jgi:hypothetical protein